MGNPSTRGNGCGALFLFIVAVLLSLLVWSCLSWKSQKRAKTKEQAEYAERLENLRKAFAEEHGATWPDMMFEGLGVLSVDVQRRLQTGSPVVLEVLGPDVVWHGENLIIAGRVMRSVPRLHVELRLKDEMIDTIRKSTVYVWVVAHIDEVTARQVPDEEGGEITRYTAKGTVIAVHSGTP